ncbi:MAG TPA: gephyrin-like molybdotransferase Glp [Solirubrobacteraceae bacterium]|nr:gephyrin-like molybdotransferase Glp [Solirubrobacteraceae bacterium]
MSAPPLEIDVALARVLEACTPLATESVPTAQADGRYLAAAATAAIDLPPFTNSAMDGFAVRAGDTPGTFAIAGESAAGRPWGRPMARGEAITISTGAELPEGADAVVPIERVGLDGEPGTVSVPEVAHDANVRHRGSDVRAGEPLCSAGVRLGPAHLAALISAGHPRVAVTRRPRVVVLTTGDELRAPGSELAAGQIYDSNGPMLAAILTRAGAEVTRVSAAADTPEAHREAFSAALDHDVVISTGGVSVGPHDLVRGIGAELGVREIFWRVKMRPGKPLLFGARDTTLVFGLPGNPVSTLVCCELFVVPALAALQGAHEPRPRFSAAPLAVAVARNPDRDDLIRVRRDATGALAPARGQSSHQISITALSDGLARIPAGEGELVAGTEVAYLPLG